MNRSNTIILFFALFLASAVGCLGTAEKTSQDFKPKKTNQIFAVSYPLQFMAQEIVGSQVQVTNAAATSGDPKKSRPSRELISQMQAADLIIANGTGATYANWLATVSLPDSKILNTASKSLTLKDYIAIENKQIVHSHGPEGEHSHPVMASRTWLDPRLAKKQSAFIAKRLEEIYPELSSDIEINLKSLTERLAKVESEVNELKSNELVVLTFDEKFKFFNRAVGAQDKTVEYDLAKIEKFKDDINALKPDLAVITQGKLTDELRAALDSLQIPVAELEPLDAMPDAGDYISVMQENCRRFQQAANQ